MSKLGTKGNPAIVRVQTEERAAEITAYCNERNWQVIVGIEPDNNEDISDVRALMKSDKPKTVSTFIPRNAPCPCGSGKQYKRCCGK